ncbi:pheromone receptor [Phlyctema vagabunda]|uniref:Pheromone receptor n=1 Tax=Phlyctema vagabunda TaxID=108571 RepID=A0ABR4PHF3_9HELO
MSEFDVYAQNLTILLRDGVTQSNFTVATVNDYKRYGIGSCINFGTQMGASLLMFAIVLVFVKETHKWKTLHILNLLSLVLAFLRALLFALYFVGPWDDFYTVFAVDYSTIPRSAYATSVTATIIPLLLTITVNGSLVLQAHSVCKAMAEKYRYALMAFAFVVYGIAVGFRFALTVIVASNILAVEESYDDRWIALGGLATETASIWFFSLVFTGKLVRTLYIRKRQGWKQYSAMQILAVGGCCTMIIPSIFASLEYVATPGFPEAGTLALTMVALLLPFSAIWAGMLTDSALPSINLSFSTASQPQSVMSSQRKVWGSTSSGVPSAGLEFRTDRRGSTAPITSISPTSIDTRIERSPPHQRDSTEIDLESLGVRVDRTFSVGSHGAFQKRD